MQMQVINRLRMGENVWYKLNTGHEASAGIDDLNFTVYTKNFNYASQKTYKKVAQVISEFESRRTQLPN